MYPGKEGNLGKFALSNDWSIDVAYLLVFVFPPLSCLLVGRFWHSVLNFAFCLTVIGIPIAMIHAWMVVRGTEGVQGRVVHVNVQQHNRHINLKGPRSKRVTRR